MAGAFSSLALRRRVFWYGSNERQHADVSPDFLSRLVELSNSMRLSSKKAAHAILSGAA
jgi:hypothetical protein